MGAFEILNNHAPIVSALGKGQIRIVEDNADHSEQLFDVESGIVEVKSNKVNVLIEK
jgi:F-type H+-transporting ATPase subunit epsilon